MKLQKFLKEKNEAILSLSKSKIIKFTKKYEIPISKNDIEFWVEIHKTILRLNSATDKQKKISKKWLEGNGFKKTIKVHEGIKKAAY